MLKCVAVNRNGCCCRRLKAQRSGKKEGMMDMLTRASEAAVEESEAALEQLQLVPMDIQGVWCQQSCGLLPNCHPHSDRSNAPSLCQHITASAYIQSRPGYIPLVQQLDCHEETDGSTAAVQHDELATATPQTGCWTAGSGFGMSCADRRWAFGASGSGVARGGAVRHAAGGSA